MSEFYFDCQPVDDLSGNTKVKEVIELRYPNLNMKISEESLSTYLGILFFGLSIIIFIIGINYFDLSNKLSNILSNLGFLQKKATNDTEKEKVQNIMILLKHLLIILQ